jgi:hypothetical protein
MGQNEEFLSFVGSFYGEVRWGWKKEQGGGVRLFSGCKGEIVP